MRDEWEMGEKMGGRSQDDMGGEDERDRRKYIDLL
jgi:hypothetical protein